MMLRLVLFNCKPVSLPGKNFGYFQIPLFLIAKTAIHDHHLFLSPTLMKFSSPGFLSYASYTTGLSSVTVSGLHSTHPLVLRFHYLRGAMDNPF